LIEQYVETRILDICTDHG